MHRFTLSVTTGFFCYGLFQVLGGVTLALSSILLVVVGCIMALAIALTVTVHAIARHQSKVLKHRLVIETNFNNLFSSNPFITE